MSQANEKKYIILENETFEYKGNTLHRIQALKDFSNVKAGDKGGWVSGYHNLSQEGECWVYDEAKVFDNAFVSDNSAIFHYAQVYENAKVYNKSRVLGVVHIFGNAEVYDSALVFEYSCIFDNAKVYGNTWIYGYTFIFGNAEVYGLTFISGKIKIYDNVRISGEIKVYDDVEFCGDAVIEKDTDYNVFKKNWSSNDNVVYTSSNKMWKAGCFYGTKEEFIKKGYEDSEDKGEMYKSYVNYIKLQEIYGK